MSDERTDTTTEDILSVPTLIPVGRHGWWFNPREARRWLGSGTTDVSREGEILYRTRLGRWVFQVWSPDHGRYEVTSEESAYKWLIVNRYPEEVPEDWKQKTEL